MKDEQDGVTQPEPAPVIKASAPQEQAAGKQAAGQRSVPVTVAQENAYDLAASSPDAAPLASRPRDDPAPKPAKDGNVMLAVAWPVEKVTVDGTDITGEWTEVSEDTAARARDAARLSGFRLREP